MAASTGEDPTNKGRKAQNSPKQPNSEAEAEQSRADSQKLDKEPEQQPEITAAVEQPRAESQKLTRPAVELGKPPRRRSLFAHWLEDRLDWLEDWLLHHKGFTEEETQVIIHQLHAHHREMEDEEWQLRDFLLVESYEKGEGDSQQLRTVAFDSDQDSPHRLDGMAPAQLAAWVLNKLPSINGSITDSTTGPTTDPTQSPVPKTSSTKITILRAQIRQPSQAELAIETQESNLEFTAPIKGNEPFDVEIQFKIDGLTATGQAKHPLTYEILFDAKDQSTNQKILLSDKERPPHQLVEQRDVYTDTIDGLRLQPGKYQLRFVITDHAHLLAGISPLLEVI